MQQNVPGDGYSEGSHQLGYGFTAPSVVDDVQDHSSIDLYPGAASPPSSEHAAAAAAAAPIPPEEWEWLTQQVQLATQNGPLQPLGNGLTPTLAPSASADPPTPMNAASYKPCSSPACRPRRRACANCQRPLQNEASAGGGIPQSTRTVPFQSNLRRFKVDISRFNEFTHLLNGQTWYQGPEIRPEPPIYPNDVFVLAGFSKAEDSSRFHWLILQENGRYLCLIPHDHLRSKTEPCNHNVHKFKDAIAHIHEYFCYRPYPCKENGPRKCGKRFLTAEREQDHRYKKNAVQEKKVQCSKPGCGVTVLPRNLARHLERQHAVT